MALRNTDGTCYKPLGSVQQYNPNAPEHDLFNQWDQESIMRGGSPLYYYEVFIQQQTVDPLYLEDRGKIFSNNPIYENNKVVGRATGGDFGFRLGKSIALGMVNPDVATTGQKLKIDILGKMYDATILDESPYDPENNLLRA